MASKIAYEFVRDVLKQNPNAKTFGAIYDAMWRTASYRSFYNLGYEELAQAGISFSLLSVNKLEGLIHEVQSSMASEYKNGRRH